MKGYLFWLTPLASGLGLVALGTAVTSYPPILGWDQWVLLLIHGWATPAADSFWTRVTGLGAEWGVLPASLVLILGQLRQRHWRQAGYGLITMGGSLVLNLCAKLLWHRLRPTPWKGLLLSNSFSFPSGHGTYSLSFVLVLVVLFWHTRQRLWCMLGGGMFVVLVGFSRVYLTLHYPTDILGGWLLAVTWAAISYRLVLQGNR